MTILCCDCDGDKACTMHADDLYGGEVVDDMGLTAARDLAINTEILMLAKVDSREVYNEDF